MIIEWQAMLLIAALVIVDLLVINLICKHKKLKPETRRKMFHMSMGLVMLSFPYLFKSAWSVGCLGIISIAFFLILRNTKLKNTLGQSLYSVERKSDGELYFVISVFLIYYLSHGNPILYSIPILILTFADSSAALTGKKYGKTKLSELNEDAKSLEGSFMFFIVAFMLVLIPLLLFTEVGREEVLIISAIIGLNVAMIEMISHSGNDNILIPITSFAFLSTLINQDVVSLRFNIIILLCIYIIVNIANKVKSWSKVALAEIMVTGYLTIILYGLYAIIPPLMLFLTVMNFPSKKKNEKANVYNARIIETNVLVGLLICAIAAVTGLKKELFMLYSISYAMHLTVNTFVRFKYYLKYSEGKSLLLAYLKGLIFVLIPSACMQYNVFKAPVTWEWWLVYLSALFGAGYLILLERRHYKKEQISVENGITHMQIVALFTAIIGVLEYISII
jgi:phytol kinase